MIPILFSFLVSNTTFSFIRDKFSLIKILLLLPSWCFSLSRLANFCWLSKAFLQYFLFLNLTMVFLDLVVLSGLPNLWHARNASQSTSTSISASIDATVASKALLATHSGMPERTILFLLPYWSRLFKFSSKLVTLSSNDLHLLYKQVFSSCSLLITMPFMKLRNSSLRELTLAFMWLIDVFFQFCMC